MGVGPGVVRVVIRGGVGRADGDVCRAKNVRPLPGKARDDEKKMDSRLRGMRHYRKDVCQEPASTPFG